MAGIEDVMRQLSSGALFGAPSPRSSIEITGNPQLDMMLAPYLQQLAGPGRFLPQQFPAQNILDQMTSAKYMADMKFNSEKLRGRDNVMLTERMINFRQQQLGGTPITEAGKAELRNFAGYMNSPFVQQIAGAFGASQHMEDLFFGQRGSAQMLGNAVGQIGFYRPDAVSGQRRMSRESLETFSDQLYSNLYGPGADLNDISGFSANRTGTIMTDLARRGLLPESYSRTTSTRRREELDSGLRDDITKFGFSKKITDALTNENTSVEEISRMEGGSEALRKVDATRVSRSLKEYTKAISVVREIFGDNGMTNAPMGQLLAAMDSLTQGGMSSMKPGQLEGLMRRTQMASRDSGVSLEGLLGLTARAGALSDKYGLPRELAAENVVTAMERVQGLRDTGGFRPGFGRLDPDKAAAAVLDQNVRAQSSQVGMYVAAAQRADAAGLVKSGSQLQKMLEVIKSGEQTMSINGKTVNVYEELARNPSDFMRPLFEEAGVSASLVKSYMRDPNTREALLAMPGFQGHLAMAAELKQNIGNRLAGGNDFYNAISDKVPKAQRRQLADKLSMAFGEAVIDDISTQQTETDRIKSGRRRLHGVFLQQVLSENPSLGRAAASTLAEKRMVEQLGGDEAVNALVAEKLAVVGSYTQNQIGIPLAQAQQFFGAAGLTAGARTKKDNLARARMFDVAGAALTGDGSNFLQRFTDALTNKGDNRGALDKFLGIVDNSDVMNAIKKSVGAEHAQQFDAIVAERMAAYENAVVDTEEERNELIARAGTSPFQFHEVSRYFDKYDASGKATRAKEFEGKTHLKKTDMVVRHIKQKFGKGDGAYDDNVAAKFFALHKREFDVNDEKDVKLMAETLSGADLGINSTAMTEGELRKLALSRALVAPGKIDDVKNHHAFKRYVQALSSGKTDNMHKDVLGALGYSDKKFAGDEATLAALQKVVTGDTSGIAAFEAAAKKAGADENQIKRVLGLAAPAGAVALAGGADAIGVEGVKAMTAATGRHLALRDIDTANKNKLFRDAKDDKGGMAELLGKDKLTKEEYSEIFGDKAALRAKILGSLRDGDHEYRGKKYKGKEELTDAIMTDMTKAAGEKSGGVGDLLSNLGSGVADALKTAFSDGKLDANFGTVTVQTLQMGDRAAGFAVAGGPTINNQPLTITGELKISNDLSTAIANMIAANNAGGIETTPQGGPPVHPYV